LPYVDQDDLASRYTFEAPFFYTNLAFGIDNQSVANAPVPIFNCPMAPRVAPAPYTYTFNYPGYPSITWQAYPADYTPLAGVSQPLAGYLGWAPTADLSGALTQDQDTPIAAIQDGTSNTILLAEVAGKNELWQAGRDTGTTLSGFYGGQGGWADATSAGSQLDGSTADGTFSPGPCGVNCSNDYGLYSFHKGGANCVFCDGSAHFIPATTNISILAGLVTRDNSDAVIIDF
jgi:prepilin-type processing-associated H-X9-DG protein